LKTPAFVSTRTTAFAIARPWESTTLPLSAELVWALAGKIAQDTATAVPRMSTFSLFLFDVKMGLQKCAPEARNECEYFFNELS